MNEYISDSSFYTNLPIPSGALGIMYENCMNTMRYPIPDIAIAAVMHTGSLFSAGIYHLGGVTQTRKRILMAPQGTGKETITEYFNKVMTAIYAELVNNHNQIARNVYKYEGSDAYTPWPMHMELEKFRIRGYVISEAGLSGQTSSGNVKELRAYHNQVLAKKAYGTVKIKVQTTKNKVPEKIYSPVVVIIHESTPSEYLALIKLNDDQSNGGLSRAEVIFVDPNIMKFPTNLSAHETTIKKDVQTGLSRLVFEFLSESQGSGTDKSSANSWKEIEYSKIDQLLIDLEESIKLERVQTDPESFLYTFLVRKYEKIVTTILVQAVLDYGFGIQERPTATREHFEYAVAYEKAINDCIITHIFKGIFSDPTDAANSSLKSKLSKDFTETMKNQGCYISSDGRKIVSITAIKQIYQPNKGVWKEHIKLFRDKNSAIKSLLDGLIADGFLVIESDDKKLSGTKYSVNFA